LSASNLKAWESAVKVFSESSDAEIVEISLPNTVYSMSCYSVLTSCEVASNFSRFDGLRFGHHTKMDFSGQVDYDFERIITKNRDEALGKVVKSRLVSGNYFLLKEYKLF
jgi:aspartyl-tRNA(Asn)/glutamyl-tRNA(Gln) amidotransferase subunit A